MIVLPDPVVERVGRFQVVRDDLLEGGTKVRYIVPYLQTVPEKVIVYASPAYGYAQIALAVSCALLGKQAVIFVAKRKQPHERTLKAKALGAVVYQVPHGYLNVVQARAREFSRDHGALLVPFGVNIPTAIEAFAQTARSMPVNPSEVWCCSGSGTLARGLQLAWPAASFHAVRVGSEPNVGRAKLWTAPEKYEQDAKSPPPFQSCGNYDAKVWQFMTKYAADNALFWNVGA